MNELDQYAEASDNECPECGAPVVITATAKDPDPPRLQLGRCSAGHLVERHLGLETPWVLRSNQGH